MKKLVITGGEGLIGTQLKNYFKDKFEVISLDISLGHDLTDELFVEKFFSNNKDLCGIILLHAYNPLPLKETKKIEPIDFELRYVRPVRLRRIFLPEKSSICLYISLNVLSAFVSSFVPPLFDWLSNLLIVI